MFSGETQHRAFFTVYIKIKSFPRIGIEPTTTPSKTRRCATTLSTLHTYTKNNISNQSRKKRLRRKENQRRLLLLIAENGLSTNTYTKKSSYIMVVTHFVGEDNAKFAEDWILHINHLIGTLESFR